MGPTWPRHPEHKRRRCRAFFSHRTAVRAALTFCQRLPAYCLWVWLKKKKKKEGGGRKMQLLKLEETECRPHRDNHRLMWHSSITTATRGKPLSSGKVGGKKRKKQCCAVQAQDLQRVCRRSVMACWTRKSFYEASQLHLSLVASIKSWSTINVVLPQDWWPNTI